MDLNLKALTEKKIIDKTKAVCRICNTELKFCNGTTNLGNHLRIRHNLSGAGEIQAEKQAEKRPTQSSIKEAFGVTQPLPKT